MDEILKLMLSRHSYRGPYDPNRRIRQEDLTMILEAAQWAPTAHNMQNFEVVVVNDKQMLAEIGNLPVRLSESFLRENYAQLSFTEEEFRRRRTGILASMFPASWTEPGEWQPDGGGTLSQLAFLSRSMQDTPLLLIVLYDTRRRAPASEGDVLGFISLGCVLENMWLMSESLGLSLHVLSAFSGDTVEQQVKYLLQIPDFQRIAYACSLGYPAPRKVEYLRVRRELQDFVHYNRFGNRDLEWPAAATESKEAKSK